jgi:hypothetical protein
MMFCRQNSPASQEEKPLSPNYIFLGCLQADPGKANFPGAHPPKANRRIVAIGPENSGKT